MPGIPLNGGPIAGTSTAHLDPRLLRGRGAPTHHPYVSTPTTLSGGTSPSPTIGETCHGERHQHSLGRPRRCRPPLRAGRDGRGGDPKCGEALSHRAGTWGRRVAVVTPIPAPSEDRTPTFEPSQNNSLIEQSQPRSLSRSRIETSLGEHPPRGCSTSSTRSTQVPNVACHLELAPFVDHHQQGHAELIG